MILLVRHAIALERSTWVRPDDERPLDERGERQASLLPELLVEFAVERVLSSPAVRCVGTVSPLAAARGLVVERSASLAEGHGADGLALVLSLAAAAAADPDVVLCTHGDVIDDVLAGLVEEGWSMPDKLPSAKGSTWVLRSGRGSYLPPPR